MINHQPKEATRGMSSDPLDVQVETYFNAATAQLMPSSGFVSSVMETIHQQATEPPPIAFPWRRALPGAIGALSVLVCFAILLFTGRAADPAHAPAHRDYALALASMHPGALEMGAVLAAVCVSIATLAASLRIASRTL